MRKKLSLFVLLIISSILVSCNTTQDKVENEVTIKKDGKIIDNIVEEFEDSNYNVEELQGQLNQQISSYNNNTGEDSIIAKPIELIYEENETKVHLHMTYKTASDYEAFNNVTLFIGTIDEAIDQGFDLNISLVEAKDPTKTIKINEVDDTKPWTLLITDSLIKVNTPGELAYYSPELTKIEDDEKNKTYSYFMYQ